MKGIILSLTMASLMAASFTADARGHRGGGGHRSYSHSFSSGYSSSNNNTQNQEEIFQQQANGQICYCGRGGLWRIPGP